MIDLGLTILWMYSPQRSRYTFNRSVRQGIYKAQQDLKVLADTSHPKQGYKKKPRNIPSWEFRGFSYRAFSEKINRALKRLRKPSEALVHCQFVSCASYPSFVFQAICAYG